MRATALSLLLPALGLVAGVGAQVPDASGETAQEKQSPAALVNALQFRDGDIAIPTADAHLRLDRDFRFLGPDDARRVLEDLWGNPPDTTVLGMVVPREPELLDDGSWAVVLTFNDEGYVSDEDASTIDYSEMLSEMQASTEESNQYRKQEGYPAIQLIGWAEAPNYDAANKKLLWAQELSFEGGSQNTLNYDIRVLGRRGYLSLNAVAGMNDLAPVRAGMQRLIAMTEFDQGERYADYDASTDKLASYGLAALVGGTLAAKSGLFAKLFALLIAGKKILIPLLLVAAAYGAKLFGRKKDKTRGE